MSSIGTMIIVNTDTFRVPVETERWNATSDDKKLRQFEKTDPHPVVYGIETFLMVFFTVELVVRWQVSTAKVDFFKTFVNIVELLVLVPKWCLFVLSYALANTPYNTHHPIWYTVFFAVSLLIVLRFARLVKVCRYYKRITMLVLTLKASTAEIAFLLYLLSVVSVVFGITIYYAELWEADTFSDMPTAVYWAFMTMNAVGYGDVVPKSTIGRAIATLCSMCGVFFTGLAVPIISSNFRRYYEHFLPIQIRQLRGNSISEIRKMAMRRRPFSEAHRTAKTLRSRSRVVDSERKESILMGSFMEGERPSFLLMGKLMGRNMLDRTDGNFFEFSNFRQQQGGRRDGCAAQNPASEIEANLARLQNHAKRATKQGLPIEPTNCAPS